MVGDSLGITSFVSEQGEKGKVIETAADVYAEVHKSVLTGIPRQIGVWIRKSAFIIVWETGSLRSSRLWAFQEQAGALGFGF